MNTMDTAMAKAAVLTEALPYIRDFRGSVVLVKLGGSVMEIEANLDSLMDDIAFMRAVGMKVVIVHGGGKAISKAIKESGHEPKFVEGLRVTDEETMEVVRRTLNNVVNPDLVNRLQKRGANARPIHGNWVFAARKIAAPDRGYVGEVVSVDTRAVCEMLDAGIIPVVTPLGTGVEDSHLYNINADLAAAQIAAKLRAKKLILMTDIRGLLRDVNDDSSLIPVVNVSEVPMLKRDGIIKGGMIPKIDCCVEAVRSGVNRAHIIDGRLEHSIILELFSDEGIGTMFYQL